MVYPDKSELFKNRLRFVMRHWKMPIRTYCPERGETMVVDEVPEWIKEYLDVDKNPVMVIW